jgi:hypothetical protein
VRVVATDTIYRLRDGYWWALLLTNARDARGGRLQTFADLNFLIVHVRQQLTKVPHINGCPADWAIAKMIGLGFGRAISIKTGIARDHQSSSGSKHTPWLSTTLRPCVIGTEIQERPSALISLMA